MVLFSANAAKHYVAIPPTRLRWPSKRRSFKNSGLGNISLRLVHSQLIGFAHLYAMVDGLGPFKDVKRLR